jgi:hypothetical protein
MNGRGQLPLSLGAAIEYQRHPYGLYNESLDNIPLGDAANVTTTIGGMWPDAYGPLPPELAERVRQRAANTRQMLRNPTGRHDMIGGPPLLAALTGGEPEWQGFVDHDPDATADAVRNTVAQGGGRVTARRDMNGNISGLEGIWDGPDKERHDALMEAQAVRHQNFQNWQNMPNEQRPGYNPAIHQRGQNRALAREARMNGGYGSIMANRTLGMIDDENLANAGGAGGGAGGGVAPMQANGFQMPNGGGGGRRGFNPLLAGLAFGAPGYQAAVNGIGDANELAQQASMFYANLQRQQQEHASQIALEREKLDLARDPQAGLIRGTLTPEQADAIGKTPEQGIMERAAAKSNGDYQTFRSLVSSQIPDVSDEELRRAWAAAGNLHPDQKPPTAWERWFGGGGGPGLHGNTERLMSEG